MLKCSIHRGGWGVGPARRVHASPEGGSVEGARARLAHDVRVSQQGLHGFRTGDVLAEWQSCPTYLASPAPYHSRPRPPALLPLRSCRDVRGVLWPLPRGCRRRADRRGADAVALQRLRQGRTRLSAADLAPADAAGSGWISIPGCAGPAWRSSARPTARAFHADGDGDVPRVLPGRLAARAQPLRAGRRGLGVRGRGLPRRRWDAPTARGCPVPGGRRP